MPERNPYHVPAGSSEGGQFTSGQLDAITSAARTSAGLEPDYDHPSREMLDRSGKIFREFTDGTASKYINKQTSGANVKGSNAVSLTPGQKLSNFKKLKEELDKIKASDPEAYDWAIKMSLADAIGGAKQLWTEIPEMVDVYRGDLPDAKLSLMTNVSLSRNIAEYWGRVTHYRMPKNSDYYVNYASSFGGEAEIFIFDTRTLERVND
jgi:hypothetical protein